MKLLSQNKIDQQVREHVKNTPIPKQILDKVTETRQNLDSLLEKWNRKLDSFFSQRGGTHESYFIHPEYESFFIDKYLPAERLYFNSKIVLDDFVRAEGFRHRCMLEKKNEAVKNMQKKLV